MENLLKELKDRLPEVEFRAGKTFFWSPKNSTITYKSKSNDPLGQWALLHEASHALLGHNNYAADINLLLMEVEAWEKAKVLAKELGKIINEDHIQDCLDTYRDWLHQRATCPRCSTVCLQTSSSKYTCHNCSANWQVSSSRFCRPYRRQSQETPLNISL